MDTVIARRTQPRYDARGLVELDEVVPRISEIDGDRATLRRARADDPADQPRAALAALRAGRQGRHRAEPRRASTRSAPGILTRCRITFEGSLGYFACGIIDGPEVHIKGRVGWSACENMMSGVVVIDGNAGSLTAAPRVRGGDLVVKGQVGARTGIDQKGGTIIVARQRRLDDRLHDAARPPDHLRRRRPRARRLDVRRHDLRRRQGEVARDRLRRRASGPTPTPS